MSAVGDEVLVERADGVVAITLNRPERLNAITTEVVLAVVEAVEQAGSDPKVRVITLTGAGRAFCAGADLAPGGATDLSADGLPDVSTIDAVNRLALAMRGAPKPVVALVNGPAVGVGSSFALSADLAFASSAAYLKTGFAAIGLMPDGGGTAFLTAALGRPRAMASIVLGDRISAQEAHELGVFARVWDADEFVASSAALVRTLADGPTAAFAASKEAVNAQALPALHQALELERVRQRELLASADFAEGVTAFNEKRPSRFTGR